MRNPVVPSGRHFASGTRGGERARGRVHRAAVRDASALVGERERCGHAAAPLRCRLHPRTRQPYGDVSARPLLTHDPRGLPEGGAGHVGVSRERARGAGRRRAHALRRARGDCEGQKNRADDAVVLERVSSARMTSARPKCPIALPAEKPTRFLIPDHRRAERQCATIVDSPPSSDASAQGAGFTRRRAARATRGPFALVKVLTRAPWVRAASAGTPTPRRKRRGCVIRVARRCYQRPRRELALTCNCARLKTRVQHVHLADEPRSHRLAARRAHRPTRFPRPNLPCPPDPYSTPTPALRIPSPTDKSTHFYTCTDDRSDARRADTVFKTPKKNVFPKQFSRHARS